MALSSQLDLYLKLERIMIDLDDRGERLADRIRDLMDPVWYSLSNDEHEFLNSRGEIDIRLLYPINLAVLDLYQIPSEPTPPAVEISPEDGVGKRFPLREAFPWAA